MNIFLSIKVRLLIFGLSISLIPIFIITTIYYLNTSSALRKQILQDFKAIAESKKTHIISLMQLKKSRTVDFSSDGFIRDSLETIAQRGKHSNSAIELNKHLVDNKKPLDPHILAIDVIDTDGMIISSTIEDSIGMKVSDYEKFRKLINGVYGDTQIKVSYSSLTLKRTNIDVSAPLFSKSGSVPIGSIRLHYDLSAFNSITNDRIGMGETGEVYIVNRDKIMLTESRFIKNAVLNQVVDTEPVRKINEVSNNGMMGIYPDYRGVLVVGASVDIPEYGWALLVEMDKKEAFAPLRDLSIVALIVGSVCGAAAIGLGILFSISTARPINRLKHATDRIASGNLEYRVNIVRKDEIGVLSSSFNNMADELTKKNMAVLAEIGERKRAEAKLVKYQRQLKRLSSALSLAEERERRIISEELHDRIGQALTVIKMKLEDIQWKQINTDNTNGIFKTLELLDQAIQDTRTLTFELSPPVLYELGFEPAVEWLVDQFKKQHNIVIDLVCGELTGKLGEDVSFFLFKSVRELLYNVVKHARAHRIRITLLEEDNKIRIDIKDDGVGFDYIKSQFLVDKLSGFGLFSIREKMEHFGGNFDVKSKSGQGTCVSLTMPLTQQKGAAGAER